MHGVGSVWVKEAFSLFGHDPFTPVISQNDPDPEFKTVSFPNPEENGVRLLQLFLFLC
jgi:phosphomannomutase